MLVNWNGLNPPCKLRKSFHPLKGSIILKFDRLESIGFWIFGDPDEEEMCSLSSRVLEESKEEGRQWRASLKIDGDWDSQKSTRCSLSKTQAVTQGGNLASFSCFFIKYF